ncbi:FIG027190: Putative transmembrane protein [hydrothermal vent metagenome]|uniref:FIG027190: Putative transmembrane protein n=1 Tax=hydrothermal vent metagenome TaxID=652676 RepID=A0A3B0WJI3_9ZZZZ
MNEKTYKFNTFSEFYPYYLAEHENITCRRLHVIGSTCVILWVLLALLTQNWYLLWLLPVIGYGFAWVGHFFFEKNKPATFKYPLYSLAGDWVMYWQVITGKIKF